MSETSIKVSLELVDKAAQKALSDFINKSDSADKGLQKVNKTGASAFNDISVHIGKAIGVYDIFVGNLAANLATKAFDSLTASAGAMFDTFVIDGVAAAQAKETALNSLNVALAQTGIYSRKTAEEFDAFADAIEKSTGIDGDAIVSNAALIQSLGQLDKDGLKRATQAAVDLSAALGIDLATASQLVGKAAAGEIGTFGRYGISIQKAGTDAETFARVLETVESRFGGAAVAKVNTYAGALSVVSATFGDVQEEVGNIVVNNNVVIAVLKQIGDELISITEVMKDEGSGWKQFFGELIVLAADFSEFMVNIAAGLQKLFQVAWNQVNIVIQEIGATLTALPAIFSKSARASFDAFKKESARAREAISKDWNETSALTMLGDSLSRISGAAKDGFKALSEGASTAVDPVNNTRKTMDELTKSIDYQRQAAEKLAKSLLEGAANGDSTAKAQQDAIDLTLQAQLRANQEMLANKQITNAESLMLDQQIYADNMAQKMALLEQEKLAEQALLEEARATTLKDEENYQIAKEELERIYDAKRGKLQGDNLVRQQQINRQLLQDEEKLQAEKVRAVGATFGALSSLMQTSSRELFEIGKASAIASATINTYEAITKTMSSVPYPFNIPLAAAQGVAGFVQVSNIASQQPRFEQGGIVGGSSFSGDKISARVNSGEMILNRSQQTQLFKVAQGNASGSSDSRIDQAIAMISAVLAQPVSIQIEGREIINVTRAQLASGRSFA